VDGFRGGLYGTGIRQKPRARQRSMLSLAREDHSGGQKGVVGGGLGWRGGGGDRLDFAIGNLVDDSYPLPEGNS